MEVTSNGYTYIYFSYNNSHDTYDSNSIEMRYKIKFFLSFRVMKVLLQGKMFSFNSRSCSSKYQSSKIMNNNCFICVLGIQYAVAKGTYDIRYKVLI